MIRPKFYALCTETWKMGAHFLGDSDLRQDILCTEDSGQCMAPPLVYLMHSCEVLHYTWQKVGGCKGHAAKCTWLKGQSRAKVESGGEKRKAVVRWCKSCVDHVMWTCEQAVEIWDRKRWLWKMIVKGWGAWGETGSKDQFGDLPKILSFSNKGC